MQFRSALAWIVGVVLAGGAMAQPASEDNNMASRMLLELQQMREEVRELRGLVEQQGQEIEDLKRRQRDQYLDLDQRIGQIASGGAAPERPIVAGPAPTGETATAVPQRPALQSEVPPPGRSAAAAGDDGGPEVRAPVDPEPEVVTMAEPASTEVRALQPPTPAEQAAYDRAFLALRETRYADAAEGFDRFLADHPDSTYAPNAQYWLGEVYYVTRDFETALGQFQRLLETYPESSKQPDALLKVGFSHYELGQWERARAALEQVVADYPGTNYSRLAENRLRTMRLEGNL